MANRFWVGATGNWNVTAGTKWATTSGGAGGAAVPTAADDVFFDAASGAGVVTIPAANTALCRSIDCTGFTGTLEFASTTSALTVGDASGGALKFVAGMTLTLTGLGTINLVSTSTNGGTGWAITTGGKVLPNVTFVGVGGKWVLQDALTATTGTITLTSGIFDTNNQSVTAVVLSSSGALARTLTLGSSAVTLTGTSTTAWSFATTTNLTFSTNTATVTFSGSTAGFSTGTFNYNGLSLVFSGGSTPAFSSAAVTITVANVTRTGTALKTDGFAVCGITCTGTFTVNGNSVTNRVLVSSAGGVGASRTINAATVSITNADFQDITGAGAGSWNLSAITGNSGDCLGNSGITFTTAATQTATGTASFSWSTHGWTSRVPLPQDNVVVNNSFVAGRTVTIDMPRIGANVDFSGATGAVIVTASAVYTLFGSLTLSAGITGTIAGSAPTLAGRSTHTLTSAGKTFTPGLTFAGPGGTYTLQDALVSLGATSVTDGTFDTNSQSVTVSTFTATSARTTVLNLGSSTISVTQTAAATVWSTNTANTTVNGTSATVVIATASGLTRTFGFRSPQTIGTVTYTVANSPGILAFNGLTSAPTITTLNVGSGRAVTIVAGGTLTVTNFNVNGAANGYLYLTGTAQNYASTPDSAALSITGDIDLIARIAPDTWTPATNGRVISKRDSVTLVSYEFYIDITGKIGWISSPDGSTLSSSNVSSVAVPFTAGQAGWIRATRSAATGNINFYTAADQVAEPSSWTALGTTAGSTAGAIFDGTQTLQIGAVNAGASGGLPGKYYRAIVKNGIAGTVVFDADFTRSLASSGWLTAAKTTFAEASSNGATVTLIGAGAQAGDGRVVLASATPASAATIASTLLANVNYVSVQDITAPSGVRYTDGPVFADVSGNTNWFFATGRVKRFTGAVWEQKPTKDSAGVEHVRRRYNGSNWILVKP